MRSIVGVIFKLFAVALGVAAVLGSLNKLFDLSLGLRIGGSSIAIPADYVMAVANIVLGLGFYGLGALLTSEAVAAFVRKNKILTMALVVGFVALLGGSGYYTVYKLSGGATYAAAESDDLAALETLVNQGKVPKSEYGSLLHRAVRKDSIKVVRYLAAKTDLTERFGESQYTLLDAAVLWSKKEVVSALLEARAPINMANKHGHTPLHAAVLYRSTAPEDRLFVVRSLVSRGARVAARDKTGKTPADYARSRGMKDVLGVLGEN